MIIFHIIGARLSGKTTLINRILKQEEEKTVTAWDVSSDFYKPLGIIFDNKIDWDKWRKYNEHMKCALELFIKKDPKRITLIESSGTSKNLNAQLHSFKEEGYVIIPIILETPKENILTDRAEFLGENITNILEFNKIQKEKMAPVLKFLRENSPKENVSIQPFTIEEAETVILETIDD